MYTFKNITGGIKTVTTDTTDGKPSRFVDVEPGDTSEPLDVNAATCAEYEKLGWFEISEAAQATGVELTKTVENGSVEQDTATREGNPVKPATAADIAASFVERTPGADAQTADEFDGMDDDKLRAFITERDGEAPHHMRKRDWLLATARGQDPAAAGQAEEAV